MTLDENPYASPRFLETAKSRRRDGLKTVALAQKAIMASILLQMLGGGAQIFVPQEFLFYYLIALLCVVVVSTVSVFALATKVFNAGLGVVYAIGALIPCVGLVVLLVVNQKATKILRDNGHEVGFFGADLSRF